MTNQPIKYCTKTRFTIRSGDHEKSGKCQGNGFIKFTSGESKEMNTAANWEMMTNYALMQNIGRTEDLSMSETDRSTLKMIFELYHRNVYRLCVQVTRNLKTAENITVGVFAEAYRELHESSYNVVLPAYLRRLTVSKLLEYRRESKPAKF